MKLLKFWAEWCGPCKNLSKTLEHIQLPYLVESINIDEQPDKVEEYNVRGIPFLVLVDDEGNPIRTMSGFKSTEALKSFLAG